MREKLNLSRSQIEDLINEWILNERNRQIVTRRMCDGIPFESLAEEFNLSVQRVKMIVYESKMEIYKHIPKDD